MLARYLFVIISFFIFSGMVRPSLADEPPINGMSREEALQLGEQMYRKGILPSGEPMEAYVMQDIPVDGRMFTCDDCHQRSGLGSVEGKVITWPTNGRELFKPRRQTGAWDPPESDQAKENSRKNLPAYWQIEDVRPAYTDETLARVILTGLDPAGRQLNPVMPIYLLDDSDMALLIYYLKNLSSDLSPGVDETTIHFATVITDDVSEGDRMAMLSTLQAHIDAHNSQNRHQERRASSGPFYMTEMRHAYRRMKLSVWNLHGPENTWPGQLQAFYRQEPVFALLAGITSGNWKPVHEFCEQNKIPSIFPLTDLPVISESDWYTLYFSKGLYQEGEAVAKYLQVATSPAEDVHILLIARQDDKNQALRWGFEESWRKFKRPAAEYLELAQGQKTDARFWQEIAESSPPRILILFLEGEDLGQIDILAQESNRPRKVFLSSRLLESASRSVPDALRDKLYLTWPRVLPEMQEKRLAFIRPWLKARSIEGDNFDILAKMYFLGWMLPGSIKRMRSEYFREYFLEGFDMMIDQDYAIAVFPRLTFGSGQRYTSKGCYIVQLGKGPNPDLVKKSDWVIH
ncbi:MAG TPA: amino acid ABC transporter substrate-binding protein [Desulfobulbaceae bacterium]|nr:amino acid ABC transporter substrate-binding protein [Desulfobulbaceae bacterium]